MINSINSMDDVPTNRWEVWQVQMLQNEVNQFLHHATDKKQQDNAKDYPSKKNDQAQEQTVSKQADFSELAEKIRSLLSENNMQIEFSKDAATNRMIMKIIDTDTNEVVRQFPPEVSLKIARIVSSKYEKGQVTNAKI